MFKTDLAKGLLWEDCVRHTDTKALTDHRLDTYWEGTHKDYTEILTLRFKGPRTFNSIHIEEYIEKGQRVENFIIDILDTEDKWQKIYDGTTIGYRKICLVDEIRAAAVRLTITQSRFHPQLRKVALYQHDPVNVPKMD